MILFWLICAGLVAIALAFILPTLMQRVQEGSPDDNSKEANVDVYRDQLAELDADLLNGIISAEQHDLDRDEIERRLLEDLSTNADSGTIRAPAPADRGPVYALAASIPLLAVILYLLIGNSAAVSGVPASQPAEGQMTQAGIEANVATLAKRLEANPNDAEGWAMLARSYLNLEKFNEASNAYAKATNLKADNADLLIEYAFVLAMTNNRQLEGKPRELIKKALEIEPDNPKALELAGSAEYQAKNYAAAISYWEKVLARSPVGSELATTLTSRINEAKSQAGSGAK